MSTFPFQRSVHEASEFIRNFGRKLILERQEAVLRGEDTPPDILAHILSVAEKEPSITVEDLVDDFATFFVAGVFFVFPEHYSLTQPFLCLAAYTCRAFYKITELLRAL